MLTKILDQKALITATLFAVFFGGLLSYMNIGKLEDAEIPMKTAMVVTVYPGASAHEVELEVTDVLEQAIQKLENIQDIESTSIPGMSKIKVNIRSDVNTSRLPQLWDHLRRKVNDVKVHLPSGAYEPIVNDDFADTYGMLYAVTSDGFSIPELTDYTEYIEGKLLDIKGVRRSQIFGKQTECVEVQFSQEKLAGMKVNPMIIAMALKNYSEIINPGTITFGTESVRVDVGSKINSMDEIEDLLVQVPGGGTFRLGDIADIQRSFMEPKREAFYFNGKPALTLGISNESGINVVKLGEEIDAELASIKEKLPAGIEIEEIYSQPDRVSVAVNDFIINLIESVAIVIVVLLLAMGLRSGLLISSGLVFTILATLIVMLGIEMPLHRVTLAAIILAMGMLVDNSIVIADGILVDLKKGVDRKKAFVLTAQKTALPLLGATLVAILAFLPLAMAPNAAGEFLSSLFTVLAISLVLSWLFAMVQTPFMAKYFYRKERPKDEHAEHYDTKAYKIFRSSIVWAIRNKYSFLSASVMILLVSFYSFRYISVDFMPGIDYDQFILEYNLPQGGDINAVEKDLLHITDVLKDVEGVTKISTAIGRPPARYTLMRYMPAGGQNYGELIVETDTKDAVYEVMPILDTYLQKNFPDAEYRLHQYGGKFADYKMEVEFVGPDPQVLRQLSERAKVIMNAEPDATHVTDNWKNKTKVLAPTYSVERAQQLGLTRSEMGNSILISTTGMPVGAYYEGQKMVPILLRSSEPISEDVDKLLSIPVWGQRSQTSTPLKQIIDTVGFNWENQAIIRYNGKRSIRAQCDATPGLTAADIYNKLKDPINEIEIPEGYEMNIKGEIAKSTEANGALFMYLPLALGIMLLIVIGLFNNLKQPLIIFTIVPFAFIGIAFGFNVTPVALNFMGIIGSLGLIGMMIKNSVVLLEEINLNIKTGMNAYLATIESAVSRMRPVMMASLTTILGMVPLLGDPMFQSMSVTIMFGLLFGSLITLFVVPVLYAVFYKIKPEQSHLPSQQTNEA